MDFLQKKILTFDKKYFFLVSVGLSILSAAFYLFSDKKNENMLALEEEEEEGKEENRIDSLPGLSNHGNICFVNSTLQVSQALLFSKFFLRNLYLILNNVNRHLLRLTPSEAFYEKLSRRLML